MAPVLAALIIIAIIGIPAMAMAHLNDSNRKQNRELKSEVKRLKAENSQLKALTRAVAADRLGAPALEAQLLLEKLED